eukprot:m.26242 g.26242  ORF g.26242 m.26242 type:complete len:404 (+) comp4257_c0_seq2:104-1315(+)
MQVPGVRSPAFGLSASPRPAVFTSDADQKADPAGKFRVGTFNLNNLCLPKKKVLSSQMEITQDVYDHKIMWTADQLRRMEADIVGFQEVIHKDALVAAVEKSGQYDKSSSVIVAHEDGQYPTVGLVSRFPVANVEIFTDFPENSIIDIDGTTLPFSKWTRPILKVEIEGPHGQHICVFVAHLKSMRPDLHFSRAEQNSVDEHDFLQRAMGKSRSLFRRAAEATALRALLLPYLRDKDIPVILLGDLNDPMGSITTEIITGTPPWRSLPTKKRQDVWDVLLHDVTELQSRRSERHVYFTHVHNGRFECLDHIMVSEAFYKMEPGPCIGSVDHVRMYTDHLLDDTISEDQMPPWQSDHGQIVAVLRIYHPSVRVMCNQPPGASRPPSRMRGKAHQRLGDEPEPWE